MTSLPPAIVLTNTNFSPVFGSTSTSLSPAAGVFSVAPALDTCGVADASLLDLSALAMGSRTAATTRIAIVPKTPILVLFGMGLVNMCWILLCNAFFDSATPKKRRLKAGLPKASAETSNKILG
jgi:hypothetical protein